MNLFLFLVTILISEGGIHMFETFMFTLLFPVIMISIIAYLSTLTR